MAPEFGVSQQDIFTIDHKEEGEGAKETRVFI